MVHSMTAFARVEQAGTHGTLSWELRSVNHRYLEPHLRLPDAFRDLEGAVREALRQGLSRGKVECTLRFAEETAGKSLQVDQERARQLVAAAEGVAALIRQPAPLDPLAVLAWPGVLVADSADPQALNAAALEAFGQALEQLKAGRSREGQELAKRSRIFCRWLASMVGTSQGPDRADARAGPEHRMTGGRLRPISFQPVRSTRNTSCPAPCTSFPLPPAPARPAW